MKSMILAFAFFLIICGLLLLIGGTRPSSDNSPSWKARYARASENSARWEALSDGWQKVANTKSAALQSLADAAVKSDEDSRAFHEKNYRRQGAIIRALMLRVGPDPIEIDLEYPEDECLNLEPLDKADNGSFFNMDSKRWRLSITKQVIHPIKVEEPGD